MSSQCNYLTKRIRTQTGTWADLSDDSVSEPTLFIILEAVNQVAAVLKQLAGFIKQQQWKLLRYRTLV